MGGFSVLNNMSSLIAQQQSSVTQMNLQKTLFRLSTGRRINSGGDDAAGLAIADGLQAQIRSLQQSVRNANDGVGYLQTADSALGQVTNLLNRAATLLTQAATDTNAGSLDKISEELTEIYREIERVGVATTFNGADIFNEDPTSIFIGDTTNATNSAAATVSFTVGVLTVAGLELTTGISGTGSDLTVNLAPEEDPPSVTGMLTEVNEAIATVASRRGTLGAAVNRLENATGIMQAQIQNLTAAESQIRDADMAVEIANLTKFQILSQVGLASMAQANAAPQGVLSLLR
jgi:flagellin